MNYHMIHLAEEPLTVDERIQNYFRRILIYDTDVEADSRLSALIRGAISTAGADADQF